MPKLIKQRLICALYFFITGIVACVLIKLLLTTQSTDVWHWMMYYGLPVAFWGGFFGPMLINSQPPHTWIYNFLIGLLVPMCAWTTCAIANLGFSINWHSLTAIMHFLQLLALSALFSLFVLWPLYLASLLTTGAMTWYYHLRKS